MTDVKTRSMDMTNTSSQQGENWSANIASNSPDQITGLLLVDGKWHSVKNCQLTQYAIGESHSPVMPSKFYPYLTFTDNADGKVYRIPFSGVYGITTSK